MNLKNIFAALFRHKQSATETVNQEEPQTEHQPLDDVHEDPQPATETVKQAEPRSLDDGHEWVDLGLPSGTLWATCNVGASRPEEYGDFFAWGETVPKTEFNWTTYKHCKGENYTMTKYVNSDAWGSPVDNLVELLPEDDAATVNWGDNWQMPSTEQFRELIDEENTTIRWDTVNGISGKRITSKANGNSIFFPAAGIRGETNAIYERSDCICWSRTLNIYAANEADYLLLPIGNNCIHYNKRGYGLTVRPVLKKKID